MIEFFNYNDYRGEFWREFRSAKINILPMGSQPLNGLEEEKNLRDSP
jgi:hypothetical protein